MAASAFTRRLNVSAAERSRAIVVGFSMLMMPTILEGCSTAGPGDDYASVIAEWRSQKDEVFRNNRTVSPVRPEDVSRYVPLAYYPIDEQYAVPAQLDPSREQQQVERPTSTGELREMVVAGMLKFNLGGRSMQLTAFVSDDGNALFVPFADLTSGTETYGSGRFIDLPIMRSGVYIVDFNKAYNPSCYYNPSFSCPLPPAENRLPVAVRAGERLSNGDTLKMH